MDLRALATLVAVVEEASFSGAAARLGYTQSAVSQQVAALERDLGAPLVTRRPVAPTPAGAALVVQARELLARAAAASAQVRRTAGVETDPRPARLVISPGAEAMLMRLPSGLATVHARPRDEAVALLRSGEADLALLDGVTAPSDPLPAEQPPGLVVRVLVERAVVVLLPVDHPLAPRSGLDLASLAAARWLDAPRAAVPLADLDAVGRLRLRRGPSYDGASAATVGALVAGGAGLAAVAAGATPPDGTVAVPLTVPRLTHRVELWRHATDRASVVAAAADLLAVVHDSGLDDAS